MKYSINSLIILQVFPQKYVPINLENKPDNPKFASMNLYDYTLQCMYNNQHKLLVPFSCIYYYTIWLTHITNVNLLTKQGYFPFSGKPGQRYLGEADLGQVPMWWPILCTCCGPLCLQCWLPCSSECSLPMPVDLVSLRSAHLYLRRLDGQPTYHQIYLNIFAN